MQVTRTAPNQYVIAGIDHWMQRVYEKLVVNDPHWIFQYARIKAVEHFGRARGIIDPDELIRLHDAWKGEDETAESGNVAFRP